MNRQSQIVQRPSHHRPPNNHTAGGTSYPHSAGQLERPGPNGAGPGANLMQPGTTTLRPNDPRRRPGYLGSSQSAAKSPVPSHRSSGPDLSAPPPPAISLQMTALSQPPTSRPSSLQELYPGTAPTPSWHRTAAPPPSLHSLASRGTGHPLESMPPMSGLGPPPPPGSLVAFPPPTPWTARTFNPFDHSRSRTTLEDSDRQQYEGERSLRDHGVPSRPVPRGLVDAGGSATPPVADYLLTHFGIKMPLPTPAAVASTSSASSSSQSRDMRRAETASRMLNIRNDIFKNFSDPTELSENDGGNAAAAHSYHQPEERPLSPVAGPLLGIWPPLVIDKQSGGNGSFTNDVSAATLMAENRQDLQVDDLLVVADEDKPGPNTEILNSIIQGSPTVVAQHLMEEEEVDVKMADCKGLTRCNLCPSPGAVALEDMPVHLEFHRDKLFVCAACPKRREFESFDEVVCHINISHNVRDSQMVLETILLPEAGVGALHHYKCGVPNCQKSFVAMPEAELRAHIGRTHGEYYIRLGRGRLLRRHCRVCGEDQSFASEAELDTHISDCHPKDQFAPGLDESEVVTEVQQQGSIVDQREKNITSGLRMSGLGTRRERGPESEGGSRSASTAQSEEDLLPAEAAPVPVFGKPLPAAQGGREPPSDTVHGFSQAVSDSEPEDGELHESHLHRKRRKKKKRRKTMEASSSPDGIEKRRKVSQASDAEKGKRRKRSPSENSSESSDEGEDSLSDTSKSRHGQRNKSRKGRGRKSSSPLHTEPKDEDQGKVRKKTGQKKLSFEKIVEKMTPKELKAYLRDFKKSQEDIKMKEEENTTRKETSDENKEKYPSYFGEKKAYYFCLICTEHVGSLRKWNKHLAQVEHIERRDNVAREAKRMYNCLEVDLQECVVSDAVLDQNPCAQCRDCHQIFYSGDELAAHMTRGICGVSAARAGGRPTAVFCPGTGWAVQPLDDNRLPPQSMAPLGAVTHFVTRATVDNKKDFPKFMLNGKLAYFFCVGCSVVVGTVIDWHRHRESTTHAAQSMPEGQPEYQLLTNLRRGNPEHKCLVCQEQYDSGEALWRHFDGMSHQTEERGRTERDWNLMRMIGDRYPNLVYCDVCDKITSEAPEAHRAGAEHQLALSDSEECYFCPAQVRPACLVNHIDSTHLEHIFHCLRCPTKYIAGEKILDHVADEHLGFQPNTDLEIIQSGCFRIPPDLRKIECDSCSACFLAQELGAAKEHVRREHGDEASWSNYLRLGCRLCAARFYLEEEFNEHSFIHYQHDPASLLSPGGKPGFTAREQRIVRVKKSTSRSASPKGNNSSSFKSRKSSRSPRSAREPLGESAHFGSTREQRSRSPRSRDSKRQSSGGGQHYPRSESKSPRPEPEKRHGEKDRDNYWDREPGCHNKKDLSALPESRRDHFDHKRSSAYGIQSHSQRQPQGLSERHSSRKKSGRYRYSDYSSKDSRYDKDSSADNRRRGEVNRRKYDDHRSTERVSESSTPLEKSSYGSSAEKSKAGRTRSRSRSRSVVSSNSLDVDSVVPSSAEPSATSLAIKKGVQQRIKEMLEEKHQADARAKEVAKKQKESELLNKIKKKKQRADDDLRKVIEIKTEAAAAAAAAANVLSIPMPAIDLRHRIEERCKLPPPPDYRRVVERQLAFELPAGPAFQLNLSTTPCMIVGRPTVRNVKVLDSRTEQSARHHQVESGLPVAAATLNQRCPFCCTKFLSVECLLVHVRAAHSEQLFSCLKCQEGGEDYSLSWSVDVVLKHLAERHNSSRTATEAVKQELLTLPENLMRISCRLCPPPHLFGGEGFWLCSDISSSMTNIARHFAKKHLITDQAQIKQTLELDCRLCDVTFQANQRTNWIIHTQGGHKPDRSTDVICGKRCGYCGEHVSDSETSRHLKEEHGKERFECLICPEVDTSSSSAADTMKEMMQHMVMKHGSQYDSYYEHITYPLSLYSGYCAASACSTEGKFLAFSPHLSQKHATEPHSEGTEAEMFLACRCCDRADKFKTAEEVEAHVAKKHKQILKCREENGNMP